MWWLYQTRTQPRCVERVSSRGNATSPQQSFRVGGQNQKWPTCGQGGYVTPAISGIPTASERGGQNQKWPTCGQGGYVTPAASGIPSASERGDKIRSGPLVGRVATSPVPPRRSPPLQSGGAKSEVAHKWSKMLQSGSVRCAKQTLPPQKGGGFCYVKTLLLPKNLANEKRGVLCKTPHAVVLRRNAPPPGKIRTPSWCLGFG